MPKIADPDARRVEVAKLSRRKVPPDLIAAELAVDIGVVRKDMAIIREAYLNLATRSYAEQVADEIATINAAEEAAWQAWEKSTQQKVREKQKMEPDAAPKDADGKTVNAPHRLTSREITRENQVGDPRFLDIVLQCADKRMKLLGLAQPSRHIHLNIESNDVQMSKDPLRDRLDQYANTVFEEDEAETVIGPDGGPEPVDPASAPSETGVISDLRRTKRLPT